MGTIRAKIKTQQWPTPRHLPHRNVSETDSVITKRYTVWPKVCGRFLITPICACWTFYSKTMGINIELSLERLPLFWELCKILVLGYREQRVSNQPQEQHWGWACSRGFIPTLSSHVFQPSQVGFYCHSSIHTLELNVISSGPWCNTTIRKTT